METLEIKTVRGQVWWFIPIMLALKRQRQKDCMFETSLCYMASLRSAWTNFIIRLSQEEGKTRVDGGEKVGSVYMDIWG